MQIFNFEYERQLTNLYSENKAFREREQVLESKLAACEQDARKVHLGDHRDYEDRVRGLLKELELSSKTHVSEMQLMSDKLTESLTHQGNLEDQVKRI